MIGAGSTSSTCEGVLFDSTAGAGRDRVPSRAELRTGLRELLRGMLGR